MKSMEYGDAKVEAASSRFQECGHARVERQDAVSDIEKRLEAASTIEVDA
jgi:hypothetical protein